MYSEFDSLLLTVEDRNYLVDEIDVLSGIAYSTDSNLLEKTIQTKLRSDSKYIWEQFFKTHSISEINWQVWKEELKKLPIIELKVGRELSREFITQMSDFFQKKNEESFLLDVKCVPQVVGGVQIVSSGKFFDFSLATQLQKYMKDNQQQIHSLLFS